MKRRLIAAAAALTLCLGLGAPAWAAGDDMAAKFPAVNTYPGFADVKDGDWYADTVKLCYEVGLMNGKNTGFDPQGIITISEAAAIAARMGDILSGGDGVIANPAGAAHWYTGAMTYMHRLANQAGSDALEQILGYPEEPATRLIFLKLLALAVDVDLLSPVNTITALPDTADTELLTFYNAGILTGVNAYGTFQGSGTLSRAECAAMAARIARPELRAVFTPEVPNREDPDFDFAAYATGYAGDTPYLLWGDGITVTLGEYADEAVKTSLELYSLCQEQGAAFSWNNTYGGQTFSEYVQQQALYNALHRAWAASDAAPVADPEALAGWAASTDRLKAKHILVEDEALARDLYAKLQIDPSQFDLLLLQHGTDPGMLTEPDGYVFGPGYMVAEFEEGTKALQPGEIGAPVKSQYGWHIIQRLPLTLEDYQKALNEEGWPAFLSDPSTGGYSRNPAFYYDVDISTYFSGYTRLWDL